MTCVRHQHDAISRNDAKQGHESDKAGNRQSLGQQQRTSDSTDEPKWQIDKHDQCITRATERRSEKHDDAYQDEYADERELARDVGACDSLSADLDLVVRW